MSKYRYLIRKYQWKSSENFTELSADSVCLFLGIGSKTKIAEFAENFLQLVLTQVTLS